MSEVKPFQELKVWQEAHKLVLKIYNITKDFPDKEQFRMVDQLCRSASSIPANIAEGKGRKTIKDFAHFLYNSRGSLEETKYYLLLAKDLGYISSNIHNELIDSCNLVGKLLNALINSLNRKINKEN
jgi:four helix bundle protein